MSVTYRYTIEVTLEEPVPKLRLRSYIKEAVEIWKGQYHPDDELFQQIKVKLHRRCSVRSTQVKPYASQ